MAIDPETWDKMRANDLTTWAAYCHDAPGASWSIVRERVAAPNNPVPMEGVTNALGLLNVDTSAVA